MIGIVVPPLEAHGGVIKSARRMIAALMAGGHEVTCISPDPDLFTLDVRASASTHRFGINEPWGLEAWVAPAVAALRKCNARVVIGYYGTTAGYVAVRAAVQLGLPSIVCLRGNDVDRDVDLPVASERLRWAVTHATRVVTVSRAMAKTIQRRFGIACTTIHNTVDASVFYYDSAGRDLFRRQHNLQGQVLGLFGEFKAKRGLDRLAKLPLSGWTVVLVGSIRDDVRKQVQPHWRIVPYLNDVKSLRAAYSACATVVQPSYADGLPNVVLEAMACTRVVVASRAGGLSELITHQRTGLLFETDEGLGRHLNSTINPELGIAARKSLATIDEESETMAGVIASVTKTA